MGAVTKCKAWVGGSQSNTPPKLREISLIAESKHIVNDKALQNKKPLLQSGLKAPKILNLRKGNYSMNQDKYPNKRNKFTAEKWRVVESRAVWLRYIKQYDDSWIVEYRFEGAPNTTWEAELSKEVAAELGLDKGDGGKS